MTTIADIYNDTLNTEKDNKGTQEVSQDVKDLNDKAKASRDTKTPEERDRIDFDGATGAGTGSVTVQGRGLTKADKEEAVADFLRERGYDPEIFWLDGSGWKESQWQTHDERWLTALRFSVALKPEHALSVNDLQDKIWNHTEDTPEDEITRAGTRVLFISDTHIGKSQVEGGGSDIICERWKSSVEKALTGTHYEHLLLVFGGDLVEGIVSQGGKNVPQMDLCLADQLTLAQQMVAWTISYATDHTDALDVIAVAGNHGDTTRQFNGSTLDNYDLSIVKSVESSFKLFEKDENITFVYPEDGDMSVVHDTPGGVIAVVHGHKIGTPGNQIHKADTWWAKRGHNGYPEGRATVLLAGHFHNYQVANTTSNKWIIYAPSLETRSTWLANLKGVSAMSGIVSFDFIDGMPININII